jgi:hypothetical protein
MSIYRFVWRRLPGPTAVKVIESAILVSAVLAVRFLWVFPELATMLAFNSVTVED